MTAWHGRLDIHYRRDGPRTTAHDRHHGPLRVLQRLYPEGDAVCHHVLVHPPGGVAGGDVLDVALQLDAGSHALLTTPGATRFYRTNGPAAVQAVTAQVAEGARLEWLPLETIAYRRCRAHNRLAAVLAPGAAMLGWDVLALGLPAAGEAFDAGCYTQDLAVPGTWLERAVIDAADAPLLDGPLGLAGHRVVATLWWAEGAPMPAARRQALLDAAREPLGHPGADALPAGATSPDARIVVLRALAHRVEPALTLLRTVRLRWREAGWGLHGAEPRVWAT